MISGFSKRDDGSIEPIHAVEALSGETDAVVWLDIEAPTGDELKSIGAHFGFDQSCLDDCLHGEQLPRIDDFDKYLFFVLYGAVGADRTDELNPRKLAIFLGARYLITVHREPLLTMNNFRARCAKHPDQVMGKGLDFMLYHIIDGMVDRYVHIADRYEETLLNLEDQSLTYNGRQPVMTNLTPVRRELLELKHIVSSQREMLTPLAKGEYEYFSESLETRFSHVRDHLTQVSNQIDGLRELLTSVRDNHRAALAHRSNEIMKVLTIMASIFIPLTFLAGIYGMNFEHMPELRWRWAYPTLIAIMTIVAIVMVVGFWRRGWIGSDHREDSE